MTNVYDGFGRLASSSTDMGGTTRTLTYGYDAEGNRTQLFHPDGAWFTTVYDPGSSPGQAGRDRPYYLSNNGSVGLAYVSYNAAGLPAAMGHAGGTGYGYDAVQRPAALAHSFSGGAGSVVWTFGLNPAGQLSTIARDNDAFAWTGHYGVNRPYTTNGLNQYVSAGSGQAIANFTYDANGNLIGDGTRTYSYDIENRLVGASGGVSGEVQLRYDPLGRLYQLSTANGPTTRFLYDGDALVAEYNSTGTMTKRYAHWVGADVPLVSYEGASLETATARWLFADHQGSIIAGAYPSGAAAWVNTYDEYGIPGAGNSGRFQYTGQIWLAELGMYHYKARIYSPTLGRFLQTDPVGYEGGINLYAYVGNDPVNSTDPSGTVRCPTDQRCPDVHIAAAQARAAAVRAGADLRGIAAARASGTELTSEQEGVLSAFERKFGASTASNLNQVARRFDRIATKIGEPGSGMRIRFSNNLGRDIAVTETGGDSMTLGPRFFGGMSAETGTAGLSQASVLLHEVGHGTGLNDIAMPSDAPSRMGRFSRGAWRGYGNAATDWLGAHHPWLAGRNTDNYNCFAIPACGP